MLLPRLLFWAAIIATGAALNELGRRWHRWRIKKSNPPATTKVSQKWARMMYHNGIISLAELNEFCNNHPEDETNEHASNR